MRQLWKWWHQLTYLSTWSGPPRSTSPVLTLGYVYSLSSVRGRTQRVVHKLLGLKPIYTTLPKALGRLSCYTFTGFPCLPVAASRALRRCCHNSFLPCEVPPYPPNIWARSPSKTLKFWHGELNHELIPSTCPQHGKDPGTPWPGFKPWCRSRTTR